jgi:3-oxoacyl-[acyl-carrier protein] reductase
MLSANTKTRGATVVVNYPWPKERGDAEKVLERIQATGSSSASQAIIVEADLSTTEGPAKLIAEAVKHFSVVDILVNNAAIAIMATLEEVTFDQWDLQINLNARGTLFTTQAVLPHLNKDARIVVISSAGARQAYERSSAYHGTKSMVEGFVRSWALYVAKVPSVPSFAIRSGR